MLKIIDFGMASIGSAGSLMDTICGSKSYVGKASKK
jgi:hypothetical protein